MVIKKLLIANRGEIVPRVMRACRELGIKTVAVYSDADRGMSYLNEADEAYNIGPANPLKSYLNIDAIINALKASGADAVHPGYGFLSENALFAETVSASGATWVGPPPPVLKAIDSKCFCRKIATDAGVPVVPGTINTINEVNEVYQFAARYGYPIVLKLDKGGGGKGIELVKEESQVKGAFERLSRIGLMAFGHPECYIEKEVNSPRHIEIQFLADKYGNCICLGERECSVQRRYQKIIEESPSPVVNENERKRLFDYTRQLALAMGYEGAGTMEFLRSADGHFYFMEINARLQVEHPVTELITGIDIVKKQLSIAAGEKIAIGQEDVTFQGHAIEARVYAEDPVTFCPSPGTVKKLSFPVMNGNALRIDHALEEGVAVPPYYDPLLAKVIAWGATRREAIERLRDALAGFGIEGIKTTIPVNLLILNNEKFVLGEIDTGFIETLNLKENKDLLKPLWPCL
ncbi:biotin carboxylase [Pelotomaculum thermopropionicum SI]|uniref:biotin carboxylase n=1 Tax=Pelotomaculum thermopropionicum (strain DSM 13744 / JCM 10971 / SI) TaxID=370438 RepID=A5D330_PELTS|nr:biotin carboxylase [Pelotomaculum thermopropionicum SI]